MPKPGKISREQLAKLETLSDTDRADLAARFTEIEELEASIAKLTKEKGDADVIVARAGEVEKASKEKDGKILELTQLLEKHTGQKVDKFGYGIFGGFFQ